MNTDEIIKALRSMATKCDVTNYGCYLPNVVDDAANIIESQQSRIAELEKQLAESKEREKAMLDDLCEESDCDYCIHKCKNDTDRCYECIDKKCKCRRCYDKENWQWRGIPAQQKPQDGAQES